MPTFKEAAQKVHASHAATFKDAKHKAQWLTSLGADVFPVFGDRPPHFISEVDAPFMFMSLMLPHGEAAP